MNATSAMTGTITSKILTAMCATALAAAAWAAPVNAADGSFDRTLKVSEPVALDVRTGSGNIRVTRGDSSSVVIHAELHGSTSWGGGSDTEQRIREIEKNPPIEQDGNTIHIGQTHDSDLYRNISISYEIRVPAQTRLDGHTGSGNFEASGIQLDVTGKTGSGNSRAQDMGGKVELTSGSGNVELRNSLAGARLTSGSGTVHGENIGGSIRASSGSGGVRLELKGAGDVEATSGSGNVSVLGAKGAVRASTGSGDVEARGEQTGDWRLHTGSGNVTVELPKGASFELDAHTGSGSIQTDREILVQGTLNRHDLRGRAGNGGPLLELKTSSGSIYLR